MTVPPSVHRRESALRAMSRSRLLRKYLGRPYFSLNVWIWRHLPAPLRSSRPVRQFGSHLHTLIELRAPREQSTGTYFFRNRPELELLIRLLDQNRPGSTVDMTILGCSKGAEVYSISYAIRTARPDLNFRLCALDISKDILEFAETGIYSLRSREGPPGANPHSFDPRADVAAMTWKEQPPSSSIFERMSSVEMEALFERDGDQVRVRPRFRDGINWRLGDAGDPGLVGALGLQDIVVANRFLCHMRPDQAEACLSNLARLVKGGGFLFVSGVDLFVRSKVAGEFGWRPVTDLIAEIHEGDPSLLRGWPLEYWGLEPLDQTRDDWKARYASVFQLPAKAEAGAESSLSTGSISTRDPHRGDVLRPA